MQKQPYRRQTNMKKKASIVIGIILILALVGILNSKYSLKENEYGLVKQFGKVVTVKSEAGLYFKTPFIQSVEKLPKEDQLYDLASSDVITSDKKSMIADCYVIWRISDPLKYYQTLKSSSNAEGRIDANVYNAMKDVISSIKQEEVIQGKDGTLSAMIMKKLEENSVERYGIEIPMVEMKLLDLPADNKSAVYARMISEREKISAQYKAEGESEAQQVENEVDYQVRVILSQAERDSKSIIAEGEAEYMRILQEAYGNPKRKEFYEFLRGLDATKNSLPEGSMLIIDEDYPIVDNLKLPKESKMTTPEADIITE